MSKQPKERWYRIVTAYAVGAVRLRDGFVDKTAPILGKLRGMSQSALLAQCERLAWKIEELVEKS